MSEKRHFVASGFKKGYRSMDRSKISFVVCKLSWRYFYVIRENYHQSCDFSNFVLVILWLWGQFGKNSPRFIGSFFPKSPSKSFYSALIVWQISTKYKSSSRFHTQQSKPVHHHFCLFFFNHTKITKLMKTWNIRTKTNKNIRNVRKDSNPR